jgi:CRP-like cAMP-binding protein
MEGQVMEWLSPSLRSKLCVHIFGTVLYKCPFLSWMTGDREAMKKLCLRVRSIFFEAGDMLFSYGERNGTVFILVNGWVTMCLGALFEDNIGLDLDPASSGVARRADNLQMDTKQLALARATKDRGNQLYEVQERVRKSFTGDHATMLELGGLRSESKREYAYITAPAFFGESLLFTDDPEPVQYSAKCMTRAEFTTLIKEDIALVVDELPYLKPHFEAFVDTVKSRSRPTDHDGPAKVSPIPAGVTEFPAPTKHPANNDLGRPGSRENAYLVEVNGGSDEDYWDEPKKPKPKRKSPAAAKRRPGPGSPATPASPKADVSHPNAVHSPEEEDAPHDRDRAITPKAKSRHADSARKNNSASPPPSRTASGAKKLRSNRRGDDDDDDDIL